MVKRPSPERAAAADLRRERPLVGPQWNPRGPPEQCEIELLDGLERAIMSRD
jgi:hypothetical protein